MTYTDENKNHPRLKSNTNESHISTQIKSEENVKTSIVTFHVARGFAILFMIFQHVALTYGNYTTLNEGFGLILVILGTVPAAPVFMFIMGFFFYLSTKKTQIQKIKRGILLILGGYILNIFRFGIPLYIASSLDDSLLISNEYLLDSILIIDIFQFAGLSLIFLTLLEKPLRELSYKYILLFIIFISVISPFLWGITINIPVLSEIFRLMWGDDSNVFFPFFPWIVFPLLGVLLSRIYESYQEKNEGAYYSRLKFFGLIFFVIGGILVLLELSPIVGGYERFKIGSLIFYTGIMFLWLGVCNYISKFRDSMPVSFLSQWSKNTSFIYVIQWIIIVWGTLILGESNFNGLGVLIILTLVLALTHLFHKLKIREN